MLGPTNRRYRGACPQISTTSAVIRMMAAFGFVWLTSSVHCGLAADAMMVDTQLERFRIRDICGARNVRLYLDYGDSGWVNGYARVRQLEHMVDDFAVKTLTRPKHNANTKLSNRECTLELVTCPSCRIRVTTSSLNIVNRECEEPLLKPTNSNWTNENNVNTSSSSSTYSNDGGSSSSSTNSDDDTSGIGAVGGGGFVYPSAHPYASSASNCKCNYISFVEPPFDSPVGIGHRICNDDQPAGQPYAAASAYTGLTRSLMIHFSLSQHSSPEEAFNLTIVAERNLDNTFGTPMDPRRLAHPSHRPNAVIVSPFFPAASTRDLIKQHLITCTAAPPTNQTLTACSIRVLFSDFQIDLMSRMEFFNSDGDLIQMFTGLAFRPPVIVCDGPSLLMRFYANGGAELRYRAEVDFLPAASQLAVQSNAVQDAVRPVTECGGSVDTLGGAITMMNMVANDSQRVHYDCIWIVRPSSRYMNAKPYLSLRVDTFEGFVEHSELSIHEGLTSVHPRLGKLQWSDRGGAQKEFVVSTTTGYYVRLRGTFGSVAKLALVYTVFSYDLKSATQFECQNQRRIPLQLQCDGFDHCGDNSDEPESCKLAWKHETYDRRWYSHTPNYYFPKTEHYPDMRAATIVFLVSTVGLVFLISGIVIMLYRMGNWARDHHDMHGHLNTISELLDGNHMDEEEEDIGEDLSVDPPAYEAPPAYDEVIKVGMDEYYPKTAVMMPPTMRRCGAVRRMDSGAMVDDENNQHAIINMPATTTIMSSSSGDSPDLDTSSDCNLVSLTSLDNLTTPCHIAVLDGQHNMMSGDAQTTASTVEMDTPNALVGHSTANMCDDVTTTALWSILSTEPTTADIIITTLDTIKGPAMMPAKVPWTVVESVDEQCNTDATVQMSIDDVNQQSRVSDVVMRETDGNNAIIIE